MIAFSPQSVKHYPKSVVWFPQVFSPLAAGAVLVQNGPSLLYPLRHCFLPRSSRKVTSFWQEARVFASLFSSSLDSADAAEIDIVAVSRCAPSREGGGGLD